MYSATKIAKTVKSLTAKVVFKAIPRVRKKLWGGEFWGKGFFVNMVGQHSCESTIANYVRNQGVESAYKLLHRAPQRLLHFVQIRVSEWRVAAQAGDPLSHSNVFQHRAGPLHLLASILRKPHADCKVPTLSFDRSACRQSSQSHLRPIASDQNNHLFSGKLR